MGIFQVTTKKYTQHLLWVLKVWQRKFEKYENSKAFNVVVGTHCKVTDRYGNVMGKYLISNNWRNQCDLDNLLW